MWMILFMILCVLRYLLEFHKIKVISTITIFYTHQSQCQSDFKHLCLCDSTDISISLAHHCVPYLIYKVPKKTFHVFSNFEINDRYIFYCFHYETFRCIMHTTFLIDYSYHENFASYEKYIFYWSVLNMISISLNSFAHSNQSKTTTVLSFISVIQQIYEKKEYIWFIEYSYQSTKFVATIYLIQTTFVFNA